MARKAFTGGDKLQKHLAELAAKVGQAATVNVGFLENATYPDGKPVVLVAAAQEFGAPAKGIPPRPFFRGMIAKESGHWGDDVAKALTASDFDAAKALDLMGFQIGSELQQSIHDTNAPPLAQSTIEKKGFDKPLIHTSDMWNAVDHEVKE